MKFCPVCGTAQGRHSIVATIQDSAVVGDVNITQISGKNSTCEICNASNLGMNCIKCSTPICEICNPYCRVYGETKHRFDSGKGTGPFCAQCVIIWINDIRNKEREKFANELDGAEARIIELSSKNSGLEQAYSLIQQARKAGWETPTDRTLGRLLIEGADSEAKRIMERQRRQRDIEQVKAAEEKAAEKAAEKRAQEEAAWDKYWTKVRNLIFLALSAIFALSLIFQIEFLPGSMKGVKAEDRLFALMIFNSSTIMTCYFFFRFFSLDDIFYRRFLMKE